MSMDSPKDRALVVRHVHALARVEDSGGETIAPAVSIYETDEAFLVAADMPGADRGSIRVRADAASLTISAAVSGDGTDGVREHRRLYARQFVLTSGIEHGSTTAEFANGVLTVRLPKTADSRRREIPVRGD